MQSNKAPAQVAPAAPRSPRLVLRADGNPSIGLGHAMRLLALAEILEGQFEEVVFAVQTPAAALHEQLTAARILVQELPAQALQAEAVWLSQHFLHPHDVLVLDGYGFDFAYQQTVRAGVRRLVCLDDLHQFPFAADLVLNPAGGVEEANYDLRQPRARLLAGPAFAPLRTAFRGATSVSPGAAKAGAATADVPATPDKVLLCLGGADPRQLTQQVAASLLALPTVTHVHAVVGSAYANWPILAAWAATHATRLTLYRNLPASELAALMRRCGAAVCSPSTVSYEYCTAGGGLLLVLPTADNQHDLGHFLREAGMALPYTTVANVLTSPEAPRLAAQLQQAQRRHFDGQAPARLQQEFRAVQLAPVPWQLRLVTAADSGQLLAWTNEPETRRQSFAPAPVPLATHEAWLAVQLATPQALLLLAVDPATGHAVGLIRFAVDAVGAAATLSYSLDAQCRGRGWAAPLLLAGTRAVLVRFPALQTVRGEVRPDNHASVRAFWRAGFGLESATTDHLTFAWVA